MILFNVTYEIMTEESAEHGEAEESGFIETGLSLRDAIKAVQQTRTSLVDGCEVHPSASDVASVQWFTVQNGMEFETGAYESRSLHLPPSLTPATIRRIGRLLGAYGAEYRRRK